MAVVSRKIARAEFSRFQKALELERAFTPREIPTAAKLHGSPILNKIMIINNA